MQRTLDDEEHGATGAGRHGQQQQQQQSATTSLLETSLEDRQDNTAATTTIAGTAGSTATDDVPGGTSSTSSIGVGPAERVLPSSSPAAATAATAAAGTGHQQQQTEEAAAVQLLGSVSLHPPDDTTSSQQSQDVHQQQGAQRQRGSKGAGSRSGRHRREAGRSASSGDTDVIADLINQIRALSPGVPAHILLSQSTLQRLDSRTTASLMKQLAAQGLASRAWQLFNWLRSTHQQQQQQQQQQWGSAGGPSPQVDQPQVQSAGGHSARLCDVFLYTAMISLCSASSRSEVQLAMDLSREMAAKGLQRNVHTFSALMNVCIKAGQYQLALDAFSDMQASGCPPNLVTYNTLIDLYGKTFEWARAMQTLDKMKAEGIEPETRTFNTLMIACNTSNQWHECLQVHARMLQTGLTPNTTTYNALISAYSKAGRLEKVMETFEDMVAAGCERSVITYSSLISACEKAGQWELALQLFRRMHQDGCRPNNITFNSAITACAQGGQWEHADEIFIQMRQQGCQPDVVTYTGRITAFEKGGQWRRAWQAFQDMRRSGCPPDHIIYITLIEALWNTGLLPAQEQAIAVYRLACKEGHLQPPPLKGESSTGVLEAWLVPFNTTMAAVSLMCWLADLQRVAVHMRLRFPQVAVSLGRGRQREAGGVVLRGNMIHRWLTQQQSPFKLAQDSSSNFSRLEAAGVDVGDWLVSEPMMRALYLPGTREAEFQQHMLLTHAPGSQVPQQQQQQGRGRPGGRQQQQQARGYGRQQQQQQQEWAAMLPAPAPILLNDAGLNAEVVLESQCRQLLAASYHFEQTHRLNVAAMGKRYIAARPELLYSLNSMAQRLQLPEEIPHDSLLLLDRAMSTPLHLKDDSLKLAAQAALFICTRQAPLSLLPTSLRPSDQSFAMAVGVPFSSLTAMESTLRSALAQDTATISTLPNLRIYLMRLGQPAPWQVQPSSLQLFAQWQAQAAARQQQQQGRQRGGTWQQQGQQGGQGQQAVAVPLVPRQPAVGEGDPLVLAREVMADAEFLNYRPSIIAAAVLYTERSLSGTVPPWPSVLQQLTGYHDVHNWSWHQPSALHLGLLATYSSSSTCRSRRQASCKAAPVAADGQASCKATPVAADARLHIRF